MARMRCCNVVTVDYIGAVCLLSCLAALSSFALVSYVIHASSASGCMFDVRDGEITQVVLEKYYGWKKYISPKLVEEYACFNTIFYLVCNENEIAVFEAARFGRNDSLVATLCGIPFTRNCDIDVHFLLNRACAGKRKCSVAVNTAFFGDPCGYEEFLKVSYRCVPNDLVDVRCSDTTVAKIVSSHGYIISPNYPWKYYMDAKCQWKIFAQPHQFIRITLFDFELDVKREGHCVDYLEISSMEKVFFMDCGVLGKQFIDVDASVANVVFNTGQTSLTQRGFLLHFEVLGEGCPFFHGTGQVQVNYFYEGNRFYANASCMEGFYLDVGFFPNVNRMLSYQLIECVNSFWIRSMPKCIATLPQIPDASPTIRLTAPNLPITILHKKSLLEKSASVIGVMLGVVSAVLLITLLLMLFAYYCHLRCSQSCWQFYHSNQLVALRKSIFGFCCHSTASCDEMERNAYWENMQNRTQSRHDWSLRNMLALQAVDDGSAFKSCIQAPMYVMQNHSLSNSQALVKIMVCPRCCSLQNGHLVSRYRYANSTVASKVAVPLTPAIQKQFVDSELLLQRLKTALNAKDINNKRSAGGKINNTGLGRPLSRSTPNLINAMNNNAHDCSCKTSMLKDRLEKSSSCFYIYQK